ncbi:sorting nexin-20 [Megalops cyprinoides]|uniref:sorting nexin-20 n=1 Tax=Megalops cyprinoides TaxID=118141 RepID=UPI00186480E1|nr:sorting nexin-20 [Megalops cyprinoides]
MRMAQNASAAEDPRDTVETFESSHQLAPPDSDTSARHLIPDLSSSPQQRHEQAVTLGLNLSPTSAMTTRELQQYWQGVRSERKPVKLLFEIPSTRTVEQALSRYVVYQIVVIKSGSYDSKKVSIERRYSDFERLHHQLLQDFSEELEEVTLPRKRLTGNFAEESIAERRLAFKDYLAQLYSIQCIRQAAPFHGFFTDPELRRAHGLLRGGQYSQALELFLQALDLQEKLAHHRPVLTVPTLCAVMVCQRDLDDPSSAFSTGQRALPLVRRYGLQKYRCPLLAMMVDLGFQLGHPIAQLQEELSRVKDAQRGPVILLSLKELVVQEFT